MERYLTVTQHDGEGYLPLVDFESWRVAVLNCDPEKHLRETANDMERHHLTDEVFVLLEGQCSLYIAGDGDRPENIQAVHMEPYKLYNVRKNVWHTLTGSMDMKLLIVENSDTTRANSQHTPIDPKTLPL